MNGTTRVRTSSWAWLWRAGLVALLLSTSACDGSQPSDGDGDADAGGDADVDGDGDADEDVDLDVPRAWVNVTPSAGPEPLGRGVHRLVFHPGRGTVVLVAGQPPGPTPIADVWEWDGTAWNEITPADNPLPERKYHELIWDPVAETMVLFGGIYGGLAVEPAFYDDLWSWTGETWQDLGPSEGSRPAARSSHGFVFDIARGRAVLFGGGGDPDPPFGDTWEWDGSQWIERAPERSPLPRFSSAMAYDAARARTVLFGGQNSMSSFDDTWEWDGETWAFVEPEGGRPPPRGFHDLAYDPVRQRVVLYGGSTAAPPYITPENSYADCWEWDGTRWTLVSDGEGPGLRSGAALAFDEARGVLVLMGGTPDGMALLNDVWELRPVD